MNIIIINGPNLNLLGKREKEIYGDKNFDSFFANLKSTYKNHRIELYQSNHEGDIIDKLHQTGFSYDGIILNAGAYTHTSVGIRDAIAGVSSPVIEVHISNIFSRESFRHTSLIAPVCVGTITGFGLESYRLALEFFISRK